MKLFYRILTIFSLVLMICLPIAGCEDTYPAEVTTESLLILPEASTDDFAGGQKDVPQAHMDIDGTYTSKEDVMNYLIEYHTLPDNFITKKEARKLGWPGGSLEPYAPGKCIGGDRFGNYEGLLPDNGDITYHECDIDTLGADSRGAKRIVYSDEGNIYYTEDHYDSFTLIYKEEDGSWN